MNKTFSNIFLFLIGVMICTLAVAKDDAIELTKDNHLVFTGPVTDKSVATAQIKLAQLSDKLGKNDVIYLVLDTPGGSVMAGNLFIDFAKSLPQKIKPISIFAASMGYHMFQSFDERLVIPSSVLMSHRVQLGGLSGQVPGELIARLNSIIDITNQMDQSVANRVGLTKEAYQKLIYDELWLNGTSAVATKHADRIVKIRCEKSLVNGTRIEDVMTPFGPVKAKFSACPLISGILDFKFVGSGKVVPRSNSEVLREIKKAKRKVVMGVW